MHKYHRLFWFYCLTMLIGLLGIKSIAFAEANYGDGRVHYLDPIPRKNLAKPRLCDAYDRCHSYWILGSEQKIINLLSDIGATVIDVGGNTVVVIPARQLFIHNTADFMVSYPNLLNLTAVLAQKQRASHIVVAANTANIGSVESQLMRTRMRAAIVGRYLQHFNHLNQPIEVLGMGSQKPVASEYTVSGRDDNNNVIISFGDPRGLGYYRRFILS